MRKLLKFSFVATGILFISFPFVAPLIQKISPSQTIPRSGISLRETTQSPYSPSHYVESAQTMIKQAQSATDPQQTAQLFTKALDTVNEGLIVYKNNTLLYVTRAEIYTHLSGSVEDATLFAISDYLSAYRSNTTQLEYGKKAVDLALKNADKDQAESIITELIQTHTDNTPLLFDLAQIQTQNGNIEGAIATYTKLLHSIPRGVESETISNERAALISLISIHLSEKDSSDIAIKKEAAVGGTEISLPSSISIPQEVVVTTNTNTDVLSSNTSQSSRVGEAVILQNTAQVTVSNPFISTATPIYVTSQTKSDTRIPYVSSKTNGSMTIMVDNIRETDMVIKWWIAK